ncbi:hypothetical protein BASA81_000790 [Batrachochytrium salamandrivorans]|nr:hypothetical protein BASA81_000790 [Batrachochytrium salamandrivorans]
MVCGCAVCKEILMAGAGAEVGLGTLRGFCIRIGEGLLYDVQLQVKCRLELLEPYLLGKEFKVTVLESPALGHRLRVAFQLGRSSEEGEGWRFGVQERNELTNEQHTRFDITTWPVATNRINLAMRTLLDALEHSPALATGAYSVNFLDTMGEQDFLIGLYYAAGLSLNDDDAWKLQARTALLARFPPTFKVKLVAHVRHQPPIVVTLEGEQRGMPHAVETGLFLGKTLQQEEGHFSNPNGSITNQVNSWLQSVLGFGDRFRLVELCSGCGNHTVGLAGLFSSVLSVEIDSKLVEKARVNIAANGIENVTALVGDVNNLARILARQLWRREDGRTVVLVDPPRGGLGAATAQVLCDLRFDYLIYIACGDGLKTNMAMLEQTYQLHELCLADHFPFTHFMEKIGVFKLRA